MNTFLQSPHPDCIRYIVFSIFVSIRYLLITLCYLSFHLSDLGLLWGVQDHFFNFSPRQHCLFGTALNTSEIILTAVFLSKLFKYVDRHGNTLTEQVKWECAIPSFSELWSRCTVCRIQIAKARITGYFHGTAYAIAALIGASENRLKFNYTLTKLGITRANNLHLFIVLIFQSLESMKKPKYNFQQEESWLLVFSDSGYYTYPLDYWNQTIDMDYQVLEINCQSKLNGNAVLHLNYKFI